MKDFTPLSDDSKNDSILVQLNQIWSKLNEICDELEKSVGRKSPRMLLSICSLYLLILDYSYYLSFEFVIIIYLSLSFDFGLLLLSLI
jgi:hypothetical protein